MIQPGIGGKRAGNNKYKTVRKKFGTEGKKK
jgi:hypothetical protein